MFDDTFDKGSKANQITPLTRVKGEGKRCQRQVFFGRQRCTKVCKGGLYRVFDVAFEARLIHFFVPCLSLLADITENIGWVVRGI